MRKAKISFQNNCLLHSITLLKEDISSKDVAKSRLKSIGKKNWLKIYLLKCGRDYIFKEESHLHYEKQRTNNNVNEFK